MDLLVDNEATLLGVSQGEAVLVRANGEDLRGILMGFSLSSELQPIAVMLWTTDDMGRYGTWHEVRIPGKSITYVERLSEGARNSLWSHMRDGLKAAGKEVPVHEPVG
jgi:hypothetical protein